MIFNLQSHASLLLLIGHLHGQDVCHCRDLMHLFGMVVIYIRIPADVSGMQCRMHGERLRC